MISLEPIKTLKIKSSETYLLEDFFLILAFRMLATLLGWWVYQLTKDPFSIGLIGLSEVIPAVSTALYAGHVIDMNEKECFFVYFGIFLLIALLLIPAFYASNLHFTGHEITYYIYGIIFFTGICRAFIGPIVPVMIPKIVGQEKLANAITFKPSDFSYRICFRARNWRISYRFNYCKMDFVVILFLILLASLFFFSNQKQQSEYHKNELQVWASMKEGITYIYRTKEI